MNGLRKHAEYVTVTHKSTHFWLYLLG